MDFVRSYFFPNEPLISWTLFSSLFFQISTDQKKTVASLLTLACSQALFVYRKNDVGYILVKTNDVIFSTIKQTKTFFGAKLIFRSIATFLVYRKVMSSRLSRLIAYSRSFRLFDIGELIKNPTIFNTLGGCVYGTIVSSFKRLMFQMLLSFIISIKLFEKVLLIIYSFFFYIFTKMKKKMFWVL